MNRAGITKQVRASKSFLSCRAREEILQLVSLDAISAHFSLCNQPICSSLRSSSARPLQADASRAGFLPLPALAGASRAGLLLLACPGCSRQAESKAHSEPWVL